MRPVLVVLLDKRQEKATKRLEDKFAIHLLVKFEVEATPSDIKGGCVVGA